MNQSRFPVFHEVELPFGDEKTARRIHIFLPPGFQCEAGTSPVVFCADGGSIPAFGMRMTRAMRDGLVPATILIGVHNSPNTRAEEYLPGVNQQRFDAHADFFSRTVVDWARTELGLSADPRSTAVFGVSNGGAFAIAMGILHPEQFGNVIAFSVAKSPERLAQKSPRPDPFPRIYLAAGTTGRENSFRRHTAALAKIMQHRGIDCTYSANEGDHDFEFWKAELPAALNWAFGSATRP